MRQQALSVPLKSIYASSTTIIPVLNDSQIVSTTLFGITLHVGFPGEHRNNSFVFERSNCFNNNL
jgi:hypothetical protein